jgi:flotillin
LNYRANAPVVDALLKEVGLVDADSGSLNDLLKGNSGLTDGILSQPSTDDSQSPKKD